MAIQYSFRQLDYRDRDLFEDKSFTVSYDPISESWISYHSYIPSIYIQHPTDYLKFEDTLNIMKSNSEQYQSDMPFILEVVFNEEPLFTKVFDSISVNVESEYQGETDNDFFDELYVYNEQQCSGQIILQTTGLNVNLTKKEKDWHINKLLDMSTNIIPKVLFTNDWDDTKTEYPIDKVINTDFIDNSKDWWLRGRFRDKYFVARFKYNNLENKKILCNFVSSNFRVSQR